MSRIGKKPVAVPDGAKVAIQGRKIQVEGPKGKLLYEHRPEVTVQFDEERRQVLVSCQTDERQARAYHGLTRALIQNMCQGVTQGYERRLEIVGVGYVGVVQDNRLELRVGFANEIKKPIPPGLDVTCPDTTHIVISGCDKQQVGQFAAEVRAVRKPEPYKGKGIRYQGEQVKIKPGKTAV